MTEHSGVEVLAPIPAEFAAILTPEALGFVAALVRAARPGRQALLARRAERQAAIDGGALPDFLPETAGIREADWQIAPMPADLLDRRVEITGPASDRKMVINALNSGAYVFMADFEDANTPSWQNTIQGQINMRDAVAGDIAFTSPDGRAYRLAEKTAVLLVRPRGWHLDEKHVLVDGAPIPGGLLDFGLYLFHNARALLAKGSGPYFYLPKLEGHLEARLWNEVFVLAQQLLGLPQGTIKATVLIETILAAFEMDEILYELREHSAGLNCGRWDYIFSCIKKLRSRRDFLFPDRAQVTMTSHFMRSYSLLAIKTCHRRQAPAIGGMSAFIPVRGDAEANERAFAQVRADKEREATDGHDGTWVAHPGLVPVALDVFNRVMPQPNQIARAREDVQVRAADLLDFARGPITEAGLRTNISVGIQYIEAWLRGQGAVPIFNLMEDAATAEISRAQVWQWINHPEGALADGRKVTLALVRQLTAEELAKVEAALGAERYAAGQFATAAALFDQLVSAPSFVEFLTIPAYERID
ncbi:malate synthase A [Chloroflexia bacterium SDU3-3]|nr:malate synthase A [Chloroflexia bacterium SDU3-3]